METKKKRVIRDHPTPGTLDRARVREAVRIVAQNRKPHDIPDSIVLTSPTLKPNK